MLVKNIDYHKPPLEIDSIALGRTKSFFLDQNESDKLILGNTDWPNTLVFSLAHIRISWTAFENLKILAEVQINGNRIITLQGRLRTTDLQNLKISGRTILSVKKLGLLKFTELSGYRAGVGILFSLLLVHCFYM